MSATSRINLSLSKLYEILNAANIHNYRIKIMNDSILILYDDSRRLYGLYKNDGDDYLSIIDYIYNIILTCDKVTIIRNDENIIVSYLTDMTVIENNNRDTKSISGEIPDKYMKSRLTKICGDSRLYSLYNNYFP